MIRSWTRIGTPKELASVIVELDKDKKYKITEYKEKRSSQANRYYWELLSELANILKTSNEELHEQMIRRYSSVNWLSALSEVNIESYGIKYFDVERHYVDKGKQFTSYKIYLPSSEMNTTEFSRLLDGLISECKEVGIETLTPNELRELKRLEKEDEQYGKDKSKK